MAEIAPALLTFEGELPDHLNWQAVSFMRTEWPWIDGGLLRRPYDRALGPTYFVLVVDDLLIAHAATIALDVEHAGQRWRMAGLGNVFTFPSFRGRGYGSQVVAAATGHILAGPADLGGLYCGQRRIGFYARHGWQPVDAPPDEDAARMMLFVSPRGQLARSSFEREPFRAPFAW